MNDPAPLLLEAEDLCATILAEDNVGRTSDEAFGRAVRAQLGRVRTLAVLIRTGRAAPAAPQDHHLTQGS